MREKASFNFAERWELELAKAAFGAPKKRLNIIALGVGGGLVAVALFSSPWIWGYKIQTDLQNVNRKIVALKVIEDEVNKLNDLKNKVQTAKQFLDATQKENHDPIAVLNSLKTLLPKGTVISTFSYTGDTVTIDLSVPAPVDVARMWTSLRDSGIFQNVDLKSVSLLDQVQKISLSMKYNPAGSTKLPAAKPIPVPPNQSASVPVSPNLRAGEPAAPASQTETTAMDGGATSIKYPGIPDGLQAKAVDANRIDISWNKAAWAVSYNIYRSTALNSGYRKIGTSTTTAYNDTGLNSTTTYYYKVSSVNRSGVEGYFGNPVSAKTFAP